MPFAVSLVLGALVGIERQRSHSGRDDAFPGGVRTFPLVALLGCSAAWVGAQFGLWGFIAIFAAFAALVVASYVVVSLRGDPAMTTALTALLVFGFGVMAFHDAALLAASLAVVTTAILSLKERLHSFAHTLDQEDLYAALKLAAATLVVLPILPDRELGPPPYDVLNPFRIWMIVVLIAVVGFAGYLATRLLGPGRGVAVAGALGGLVSSTAVTLSFAGRSRENPELAPAFALGIALSWTAMLARLVVVVIATNRSLLAPLLPPIGAAFVVSLLASGLLFLRARTTAPPSVPLVNPFSLSSALKLGALFAVMILVARFAQVRFQDLGLYAAAAISGTVDVDVMAVAMAKLEATHEVPVATAVRAICLTVASSTVAKGLAALVVGARGTGLALLAVVVATIGAGAVTLAVLG
jgi:uncharacterized membrane protein (DUF4010 family)